MRIGLFTDTYPPFINGVSTSVAMLKRALEQQGHTVYVVTVSNNALKHEYDEKERILRVPGIPTGIYDSRFTSIYPVRAVNKIKSWKLDVIHSQTEFAIGTFARLIAKQYNIPLVHTYHTMYEDYTYYITKGYMDRASKWIIRQYSLAVSDKTNMVITPSYKSQNYLRKIGASKYIGVIPTGIDTTRFINYKLDPEARLNFLKEQNIPENSKIMLFLGRMAKEKNIEELLDNFKSLTEKRDDVYFVVVGDGPNRPDLEKKAKELGIMEKTRFIGAVPYENIDFYYALADVFVNASVSETQGLTYLEAMASKKVVLAKYDSNLSELIVDGYNGFFFDTKEEFLQKIGKIFEISDTTYNVMVKNMLESVDKLSLEKFYTNIMEVYEKAKRNNI